MTEAHMKAAGLTQEQIASLTLKSGAHSSPQQGACLLEVVSMFAGEPFSDKPQCVDYVLAEFGRSWNDGMRSDEEREQLKRYIPLLPGTNQGEALSQQRAFMLVDWMIRVHTPAWLDLSPSLAEHAAALRALAPITGERELANAQPTLDQAQRASAARAAAWDAAWAAARDAAWAATMAAAWAAARDAARDAAWDAAWAAARDAAWDAARAAAWAAARDAARAAARAAAWDAARDAARDAAWDAARDAAWAATMAAAPGAERAAADAALAPTVQLLQSSAHDLFLQMINAQLREIAAPSTVSTTEESPQ